LTDTLTREGTSVVNCRVPASGAFVASVNEGPDKMVTALAVAAVPSSIARAAMRIKFLTFAANLAQGWQPV
jgi:hypothetical protein